MNNSLTKSNNKQSMGEKYLFSILHNNNSVSRYKKELKNRSNKEQSYFLTPDFINIEETVNLISKFLKDNNEKVTLDNIILILDNLYNKKIKKFLLFKLFFLKINKQFKKFKTESKNSNASGIIHNLRNMILFYLDRGTNNNSLDKELDIELNNWFKVNFQFNKNTSNKLKIELLNKDIEKFKKILEQIKLIDNIYNSNNDNIRIELSKIDCFKYLSNEYSINNNKLNQNIVKYFNKSKPVIKVITNSDIKKININNTLSNKIKNNLSNSLKSKSKFKNAFHNLLILTKQFFDTNIGRNTAGGHAFEVNGLGSSLAVITFLDYWNKSSNDIKLKQEIVNILNKQENENYTGCTDGMINRINDLLRIKNIPYVNINTNKRIIKKYFNK